MQRTAKAEALVYAKAEMKAEAQEGAWNSKSHSLL